MYDNPYAAEFNSTDTTTPVTTVEGVTAGRTFIYAHETGVNDDKWRYGTLRLEIQPDGMRGS